MNTRKYVHSNCTLDDWRNGIHEAWEVAAHVEAKRFYESKGIVWTVRERGGFVDRWLQKTRPSEWNTPTPCEVCQDKIAQALLEGRKPFQIDDEVAAYLKEIKARVMTKVMPNRAHHIRKHEGGIAMKLRAENFS